MEPKPFPWSAVTLFFLVLFALLGVAYVMFPDLALNLFSSKKEGGERIVAPLPLSTQVDLPLFGTAYLTLKKTGEETLGLYALDLASGGIREVEKNAGHATLSASGDVAFVAYGEGTTSVEVILPEGRSTIAEEVPGSVRNLAVSSTGDAFAFNVRKDLTQSILTASTWEVRVGNLLDRSISFRTPGYYPQYAPGGDVVYLKDDGLYAYNPTLGEYKAWNKGSEGPYPTNQTFAFSKDGTQFAWTTPEHRQILLFRVLSVSPVSLSLEKALSAVALFPQFSEDGKTLLVFEKDYIDVGGNPRIEAIDIATNSSRVVTRLPEGEWQEDFIWLHGVQ